MTTTKLLIALVVISSISAVTVLANFGIVPHCTLTGGLAFLASLFVQDWAETRQRSNAHSRE